MSCLVGSLIRSKQSLLFRTQQNPYSGTVHRACVHTKIYGNKKIVIPTVRAPRPGSSGTISVPWSADISGRLHRRAKRSRRADEAKDARRAPLLVTSFSNIASVVLSLTSCPLALTLSALCALCRGTGLVSAFLIATAYIGYIRWKCKQENCTRPATNAVSGIYLALSFRTRLKC